VTRTVVLLLLLGHFGVWSSSAVFAFWT
jgi:hypothetical protein